MKSGLFYFNLRYEWIVTRNMYKVLLLLSVVEVLSSVTHLVLQNEDIYTKVRATGTYVCYQL